MIINESINVELSWAHAAVGTFERVKLKNRHQDIFQIIIDSYYINCVEAEDKEYKELKLESGKLVKLKAEQKSTVVKFPDTVAGYETNNKIPWTDQNF